MAKDTEGEGEGLFSATGSKPVARVPLLTSLTKTDSTIPPPPQKITIFFHGRFMAAWHEEGCYAKSYLHVHPWLERKGCRTMASVGVAGGNRISGDKPGSWFKPGDFVQETLGGEGGYRGTTLHYMLWPSAANHCIADSRREINGKHPTLTPQTRKKA